MSDIQPIQTRYKGFHFRSRAEARWAVFFDALEVVWEYEKEGYRLPSGSYLPDFFLPEMHLWVEIKGAVPTESEKEKCRDLRAATGKAVLLVQGLPGDEGSGMLFCSDVSNEAGGLSEWDCAFAQSTEPLFVLSVFDDGDRSFFTGDMAEQIRAVPAGKRGPCGTFYRTLFDGTRIRTASEAAKSARFEHGESGAT